MMAHLVCERLAVTLFVPCAFIAGMFYLKGMVFKLVLEKLNNVIQNKSALEEDALQLWLISLRNASVIGQGQPDYLDLFPYAIQCLSENLDVMGTIVLIIESYLLLNVHVIMSVSGPFAHQAKLVILSCVYSNSRNPSLLRSTKLYHRL
jgi:hypothetical protein